MRWMVHVGPRRIDLHQKFSRILRSILSYKLAQKRSIPASLHEEVNTQFPFLVPLRGKKFHQACIAKDMKVEENTWRKGYWMNPTWRQGLLEAGQTNEILRKYRTWLSRFRGQLPAVKAVKTLGFEELCARDEQRLANVRERCKRKRKAAKDAMIEDTPLEL